MILVLYSMAETDWALGRNPVFKKMPSGRNFQQDEGHELAIESKECINLKNYDLESLGSCNTYLGIGHTDYRTNLARILEFISE